MKFLREYAVLVLFGMTAAAVRLAGQPAPPPAPAAGASSGVSAKSTNAVSGPLIQFDNKEYNFGKVEAGESVKHTFLVTNTGDQTLEITNVHPGCGCTTAGSWSHKIEPGKTGSIPIQYNSAAYAGAVTKYVDVYSNAKDHPQEKLYLKGTIWKALEVVPQTAVISLLPEATNSATTTVHIINHSDQLIEMSDPTSSSKSFSAQLKATEPGKAYELQVTATPPFPVGNTPGTISVKTTRPGTPILNVSVTASVQAEVQVSPPRLTLAGVLPNAWTTNRVFIRGNGGSHLELSDPTSSDTSLRVQISAIGTPNMYILQVAVPPSYQIEPGQQVEISVKSSNARHPVIKVPVGQLPRTATGARPAAAAPMSRLQGAGQTAGHP